MKVKLILMFVAFLAASLEFASAKPANWYDKPNEDNHDQTMTNDDHQKPQDIPGTDLQTRTFYKLGLKKYSKGFVTWTNEGANTFNYVQIDNDPSHLPKYKQGGEYYEDSKWEFIPVLNQGQETGWYGLRNRGRRGAYMTWSTIKYVDESKQELHLTLDKNYPVGDGGHKKGDYFLKPIRVNRGGQTYYQLKLKNLPNGVVTWSRKGYGSQGSHYIEVDNNRDDQGHMKHYREGGKWYDDTLFTIDKPEVETPEEDGEMGDLEQEKSVS